MFAYGVGPCARVDLVTGPGSIHTVTAKRLLKGQVGIDSEAGPTEIAILADDTADASYVAADLVSQAEHDPLAAAVLVTDSPQARRRGRGRARQAGRTPPSTPRASSPRSAAASRRSCWSTTSSRASTWSTPTPPSTSRSRPPTPPRSPPGCATRARSSSGAHAPVSLGDYCAGSNHVLPTGGCACHSSGLSVRAFVRSVQVVDYSREALAAVADHVVDPRRRRGPARPRRRGARPVRGLSAPMTFPPLREELRGLAPYGAPAARRARAAQRQREPLRPGRRLRRRHHRVGRGRGRRPEPLPRPRVHRAAQPPWRATSPATRRRASRPSRCGRPTAPTR